MEDMENGVISALKKSDKSLKLREIARFLNVKEREKLKKVLKDLALKGKIVKLKGAVYTLPEKANMMVGKLCVFREGFGFVDPLEGGKGVFVPKRNMAGAMNGDIVTVAITKEAKDGKKEGRITSILKRSITRVVGRVEKHRQRYLVIPEDKRIRYNLILTDAENVKDGDYVVANITSYPTNKRGAIGEIVENLGQKGPKLDIEIIIRNYDIRTGFPAEVIQEANAVPDGVTEDEIKGRTDLRNQLTFTIDGETARDFDDAIAIEKLKNGNFKLFVHIADVSHYVKMGGNLDKEAFERGTSVYFPDRCIPMLPERLSNGICSLNPNADRLVFTCEMEIDKRGTVVNHKIYESAIRSNARLTYKQVQRILDREEKIGKPIEKALDQSLELARILHEKRYERGSLDFDLPEPVVVLNAEGEPTDIYKSERLWSHRIIEEFMIAANETVAEFMFWGDYPSIYRVHESPDKEKLSEFLRFCHSINLKVPNVKNEVQPKMLQEILEQVSGKPEEKLVNYLMLRTMARAKYSPSNIGHFGLASTCYTHFTSPIRRYADLELHRLIKTALRGKFNADNVSSWNEKLEMICKHVTEQSINADKAERDVIELKKLQFVKNHVGEVFEAIITGVGEQGLFIETVETLINGFIHVSELRSDYYICVPKNYCLVGEKTGKTFRIGDRILAKLLKVDIENRKADFRLVRKLQV